MINGVSSLTLTFCERYKYLCLALKTLYRIRVLDNLDIDEFHSEGTCTSKFQNKFLCLNIF